MTRPVALFGLAIALLLVQGVVISATVGSPDPQMVFGPYSVDWLAEVAARAGIGYRLVLAVLDPLFIITAAMFILRVFDGAMVGRVLALWFGLSDLLEDGMLYHAIFIAAPQTGDAIALVSLVTMAKWAAIVVAFPAALWRWFARSP